MKSLRRRRVNKGRPEGFSGEVEPLTEYRNSIENFGAVNSLDYEWVPRLPPDKKRWISRSPAGAGNHT